MKFVKGRPTQAARPTILTLAMSGVAPFTKTWKPDGYEGYDEIEFDFEWSPTQVGFTRIYERDVADAS